MPPSSTCTTLGLAFSVPPPIPLPCWGPCLQNNHAVSPAGFVLPGVSQIAPATRRFIACTAISVTINVILTSLTCVRYNTAKHMFKIACGPITITCDTSKEFEHALGVIRRDVADQPSLLAAVVARAMGHIPDNNPWTPRVFSDFVTAIGPSQTTVLARLVRHTRGDRCPVAPRRRCGDEPAACRRPQRRVEAGCGLSPVSSRGVHHRERIEIGRDEKRPM